MTRASAASKSGDALHDGVLELGPRFELHHGDVLEHGRVAYRLAGHRGAPVVAVLGGISSNRFVCSRSANGWWRDIAAPGAGVDTDAFAVLGIDFLGGTGDSSAPATGAAFAPLSTFDQAAVLVRVLDALRVESLHALVGSSYGGMVALAFAQRHPTRTRRIVVMSAGSRPHPMSTAIRSIQRQVVREAIERGDGAGGLRIARALAMTTYRSPAEFLARFDRPAERREGRFHFPVEDYLFARGDHYAQSYRPESFVALSESVDLHRVEPDQIATPATLIGIRQDRLVPIEDMRELAERLRGSTELVELDSVFGHDAFLKEGATINPVIARALEEDPL